jgi:hypothetical protein
VMRGAGAACGVRRLRNWEFGHWERCNGSLTAESIVATSADSRDVHGGAGFQSGRRRSKRRQRLLWRRFHVAPCSRVMQRLQSPQTGLEPRDAGEKPISGCDDVARSLNFLP